MGIALARAPAMELEILAEGESAVHPEQFQGNAANHRSCLCLPAVEEL